MDSNYKNSKLQLNIQFIWSRYEFFVYDNNFRLSKKKFLSKKIG